MDADARRLAEEKIAEELHEQYRATARRVGWPMKPAIDCTYDKLTEEAKELDRVFARWHLDAVAQMVKDTEAGGIGFWKARAAKIEQAVAERDEKIAAWEKWSEKNGPAIGAMVAQQAEEIARLNKEVEWREHARMLADKAAVGLGEEVKRLRAAHGRGHSTHDQCDACMDAEETPPSVPAEPPA